MYISVRSVCMHVRDPVFTCVFVYIVCVFAGVMCMSVCVCGACMCLWCVCVRGIISCGLCINQVQTWQA